MFCRLRQAVHLSEFQLLLTENENACLGVVFKLKWDNVDNRHSFLFHLHSTLVPAFDLCTLPRCTGQKCSVLKHMYSDHPRSCVTTGCTNILAHLRTQCAQQTHTDNKTPCSGPLTDHLQRWRLLDPGKEWTFIWLSGLGGLTWRALFFQTSKFKPSHCQRQHTELNEAAGWTNMANRIALTPNMPHITLNYSTWCDWTHIAKGER